MNKEIPLQVDLTITTEDGAPLAQLSERSTWEIPAELKGKPLPVRCTLRSLRPPEFSFDPPSDEPPCAQAFDFELPTNGPDGQEVRLVLKATVPPDELVENHAVSDQGVRYAGGHRRYSLNRWR